MGAIIVKSIVQSPYQEWFIRAQIKIRLVNLLQIALPITGQWVTDNESINPISITLL